MINNALNKDQIMKLLPHREPMLLIDELTNIVPNKSAVGVINVKKESFFFQGHFPRQPIMPGVIIVEAFGQAAAALTAYSLSSAEVEDKLVYLMSVDKARFRNPIIPDCKLFLEIKAIRSRGRVWRYQGIAKVNEIKMADAKWAATIMDRSK